MAEAEAEAAAEAGAGEASCKIVETEQFDSVYILLFVISFFELTFLPFMLYKPDSYNQTCHFSSEHVFQKASDIWCNESLLKCISTIYLMTFL